MNTARSFFFFLAAGLAAAPAAGQEPLPPSAALPDAVQRELAGIQDLLARAAAEFEGPQQSRSIVLFDEIVSRLETLRGQGMLPVRAREILSQAYELRARAYYNIGLQEKAADSFRTLIQLNPQYAISKERVSPKIVDYFNSVKKALVGYLAVSSRPAGAKVSLNGEFLSLTDFFPLEVLAGEYTVEVAREGYRTETRSLSIAPRATETLEVELTRTSASAFVVTEPAGVEIWVDGELRTTTGGSVGPELIESVRNQGLDPSRASARTELGNLSLGSHILEFRRKCHEPIKRTIELVEARDYETEGVKLEESLASLQLRSDPPGGRIFLDGEPMGITPKDLEGVCSGRHRVEVKHLSGKFIQEVTIAKDESLTLDCPIRPSLAFLGVLAESAAGERVAPEVEEKLVENLSKVSTLNFVPAQRETVDRILEGEKLTRMALLPGSGTEPDLVRKATEKLAAALEVQGFLVAWLPGERLQRTAVLYLLAAGNTVPDMWDVSFGESASYMRFLSAVDRKATLYKPWSGLITVDTLLHEGVPVLRVVPNSPAARAGLQVAEVLATVDGKPVTQTTDLLKVLEGRKAKEKLSLGMKGPSGPRVVEVTLGETPQEIPLNEPSLLYNKVMMDLRQQVEGYPGTETAAFARLNLAICAMHFGDFAAAHEHLLKARTELPTRPGLSQGTALYYLGLALERLGYKKEAVDAYRAAAGFKEATLFNNDGPAVAPLAARRAGS
ncbi:MAG TPA: PEGA domain-containing protein [Vicinamibacteria bacterium]|nr:PEGA domain-containing protein [Vicinamibacteria bacterium]